MSEYQYYEFAVIDRRLTSAEMAHLRGVSTRAEITPTGFVNHYEWGDLKADPTAWMRHFFDAFVYSANWCRCRLALRVPLATFGGAELEPFSAPHNLSVEASDAHWIIDWSLDESQNHERFSTDDGSGWMRRLVPLRDELLRGDLRPLYLGWLAAAAGGGLPDNAREPELPPGLAQLSPPQEALVEFLEIDPDILAVATAGSARASQSDSTQATDIDTWLKEWSRDEMAAVLKLMAQGEGHDAERRVRARHAAWLKAKRPPRSLSAPRRSVGQLRELAQSASGIRFEHEAKEHARVEAELRGLYEANLRLLMTEVDKHWEAVDALVQRGSGSGYDEAVRALIALAEGYTLTSRREAFDHTLRRMLVPHTKRGALMRRLSEAGLWSA
jgi:hypothetical protein